MNLEAIARAYIELGMAFDPKEAPGGAAFWNDVRARLKAHHHACETTGSYARGTPQPAPNLTPPKKPFPTLIHALAVNVVENLNLGIAWADTDEGYEYWKTINQFLAALPYTEDRQTKLGADFTGFVPIKTELAQLCASNLEPALFATQLWYKPGQWPHHDPEDRTLIRYLPRNKPPLLRNFVTAKPGKFLTAYYDDQLTETQIADLAARFRTTAAPPTLLLATTADDIAHVYLHGPTSCMASGKKIEGIEPVRAYASPDLALAYIMRDGKPTARCIVRPSNKAYSRIYGDAVALMPILARAGYENNTRSLANGPSLWHGARLTAIPAVKWRPAHAYYEAANEPVCITPYFDLSVEATYSDKDGYLHIGPTIPPKKGEPARHLLKGGFSIHAIPKGVPPPIHPTNRRFLLTTWGASGTNGNTLLPFNEAERLDPTLTKGADKSVIDKKLAEQVADHAAAVEAARVRRTYEEAHARARAAPALNPLRGGFY